MFIERFILSNFFSAVLICIVLGLKWLFRNHLSMRSQYYSWYILLISILLPFLPNELWKVWHPARATPQQQFGLIDAASNLSGQLTAESTLIQDTTKLVHASESSPFIFAFLIIWMIGMIALIGIYWYGGYRLRMIKQFAAQPTNQVQSVFARCYQRLNLTANVQLRQSVYVTTPVSFGIRKFFVVLPRDCMDDLSEKELEHILTHELVHILHGDLYTNYLLCAVQALLWFNPFVWIAFRQLRCDREAYCDWGVMNELNCEEDRIQYGQTILHFAAKRNPPFRTAAGFCQNKDELKYRIHKIVHFKKDTRLRKMGGRIFACVLAAISITQVPVLALSSNQADNYYTPSTELTIKEADWNYDFDTLDGCAVVYDLNNDSYIAYNKADITRRFPPCSTYKIYSALNALEQGIISPADNTLAWDSTEYRFVEWNHDQDLCSAMQGSVNWYFYNLDRSAGVEELESFYQKIGYGNGTVGDNLDNYSNGSSLQISPLEQVELLVKLYRNDFHFDETNIRAIKNAILLESNDQYKIYGKTGTGNIDGRNVAGWYIGFVEQSDNTYFFATYLHSDKGINGPQVQEITLNLLSHSMGK